MKQRVSRYMAMACNHRLLGYTHQLHNHNYLLHKINSIRDLLCKNIQQF